MRVHRLPWTASVAMLVLCTVWGGNLAAIKVGAQGMAPVAMAATRSLVAALCLWVWMRLRRLPPFPDRVTLAHGIAVGLLFGLEFCCVYTGLRFTLASRGYVFLYTQPFFTALGAHFLLRNDRLTPSRSLGLVVAFAGVASLFVRDWGDMGARTLPGDVLLLLAGALWGATTLYIKRFLAPRTVALQTLFYQLAFSVPVLMVLSLLLEDRVWMGGSWPVWAALFYQCIIVAFLSYLVWFELIHRHPVSVLGAFTFFTPVFGALISGVFILGEPLTGGMLTALVLVILGMFLVNRPARPAPIET